MNPSKSIKMEEITKRKRLILFPIPLEGHMNPMLKLADLLYSKGFSITIIHTQLNSPNPSLHPHFTFRSIPDGLSESEASPKDIVLLFYLFNTKCVQPFKECLSSLLSEEPEVACLISDAIFHFTQSVAESFKLPRFVFETGSMTGYAVFSHFSLLREKGYLPVTQDSQPGKVVTELPPLRIKDLPVIPKGDPEKFFEICVLIASKIAASDGVIFNTFKDLEEQGMAILQKQYPDLPVFPIGPFHDYEEASSTSNQSCISWLNTRAPKSVIYVSFGTIAAITKAQFLEIAWGLSNSNQPFLWVVRPGLVHGSDWLELLPNRFLENLNGRGHIVKWAPQKEVLSHPSVGGFWTHNGWNSTLESVCAGVPMICFPCFGDQMVLARYVSKVWKIGLQYENEIERGEIEATIRKLMEEKEGEEIRDRSLKLMEKANVCCKPGGSSSQCLDALVKHILSYE
ncbi:UDP-glycosyltransferase 76B1-like [Argentina anserina]|uniref:UDP-glycosyltransferase 76B1-like n=1 Tax=Argentina anserina TaxID=57926 RepID=UPI0021765838|nr:UDP-glycosyltransferase 76B1-like [Potentilla anserina]